MMRHYRAKEMIRCFSMILILLLVGCGQQNNKTRNPCIEIHGFPKMRSGISDGWDEIFKNTLINFYKSSYRNYKNLEVRDKSKCEPFPHLIFKLELWEGMSYPDSLVVISATTITAGAFPQKNIERNIYSTDSATYVIVNEDKVTGTTGNETSFSFKTNSNSLRQIFFEILRDLDPYGDLAWYMPFCRSNSVIDPLVPALENCP